MQRGYLSEKLSNQLAQMGKDLTDSQTRSSDSRSGKFNTVSTRLRPYYSIAITL